MTSTMTSSGVRQTPAFAIPSTQNTAPVLDYRCLYTHDLRRKQKRWQDGVLRFHTFNKRIMVYDVSRNYIGDMHWRENEVLQDGDEFELDRGVLIQVGERTGSMEQDLTGLFEKRKKAPEVAVQEEVSSRPVAVPTARSTTTQPSQLRPKTLNALLGTPKGRVGRAALPTKSPHELRTESENLSCGQDRPAKRQRIESQLEKRAQTSNMLPRQESSKVQAFREGLMRPVVGTIDDKHYDENPVATDVRDYSLPNTVDSVNMLPPSRVSRYQMDNEDAMLEPLPKKRASKLGSSKSAIQQKRKSNQNSRISPRATKAAKRPGHELETYCTSTSSKTNPIAIVSDEDATPTDKPPNKGSKLMMASRKPRKKLMYQDLLLQGSSAAGRSSGDNSVLDRSNHNRSTLSRAEKQKRDPMTEFHKEEQDRLKAQLSRHNAKEIQRDTDREQSCGDAPEDLFLSQEPIDTTSVDHYKTKEKDPKERLSKSSITGSRRRNTEPVISATRRSPSLEPPQKVIPRPPSTVHSTAATLAKMDEILFPRAQVITYNPVQDKDALTEILHHKSSRPKTPPDVLSAPSTPKDRPSSSPAFQIQTLVPFPKDILREKINNQSRPKPDSLSAFAKAVQPKAQATKQRRSISPPSESHLSSIAPPPQSPIHVVPAAPSPPTDRPVSPPDLQPQPETHPNISPTPQLANATIPPLPNAEPTSPLVVSKTIASKHPTAPAPVPTRKTNKQPTFTKPTPTIPTADPPNDEIIEVLSSQPPSSLPPSRDPQPQPDPPKRNPYPPLPAFTKVIPKTKPRSVLMKSVSDTPRSALPISIPSGKRKEKGKEEASLENPVVDDGEHGDEGALGLWNKEAWDLFGCGRDGVECTYEEFKRKEGLM